VDEIWAVPVSLRTICWWKDVQLGEKRDKKVVSAKCAHARRRQFGPLMNVIPDTVERRDGEGSARANQGF